VRLVRSYYPRPDPLSDVAARTGIETLLDTPYARLSGGQQRRVQFALAVCGNPQLLVLDEPTTGLDIEGRESLWEVVRELGGRGCAILLTTHYLEEAEALAGRVAVLVRGRVVSDGTVDEIRATSVRRRIRCISSLDSGEVRSWPCVSGATREREWLQIESTAVESVLRRLLSADPGVREIEVRRAGLAEAFVQITREAA